MNGVPGAVVHRVVERHLGERHVADDEIGGVQQTCGLEAFAADVSIRMQQRGDARRDGFELDPHGFDVVLVRSGRQEHTSAAARLEHSPTVEAERGNESPDGGRDAGVGVVGIERRSPCGGDLRWRQQLRQLGADTPVRVITLVERVRQRAPARPSGENRLLVAGRRTLLGLERAEEPERVEVGGCLCCLARRCEGGLVGRPEAAA